MFERLSVMIRAVECCFQGFSRFGSIDPNL
jgi:hypothetical protein